jgi:hypothetical protein
MTQVTLSKDTVRAMAERLRDFAAAGGTEFKQTHAYEAVARMLGYRNWNTLQGILDQPGSKQTSETGSDPIRVYWPWVRRAAAGKLHSNGTPIHRPITWQAPKKDGSSIYRVQFPSLSDEPPPFDLPVKRQANDVDGEALLGIFVEAVACLLEVYADKKLNGIPEMGREVSQNLWHCVMYYHVPGLERLSLHVRAQGTVDREESRQLLIEAAYDAVRDLRKWSAPLLENYRQAGKPWEALEEFGDWVPEVLRTARLKQPHTT